MAYARHGKSVVWQSDFMAKYACCYGLLSSSTLGNHVVTKHKSPINYKPNIMTIDPRTMAF